jgi:hypothetical protein
MVAWAAEWAHWTAQSAVLVATADAAAATFVELNSLATLPILNIECFILQMKCFRAFLCVYVCVCVWCGLYRDVYEINK